MLKIYIYGYLNRVQSSRRLERECQRNVEVMWLTGCLAPDFKTIADFRKDNGPAIRKVCREFIVVCGRAGLLAATTVAIDGSKFKAVNSRDRNFTQTKVAKRLEQIEASIERYLSELETANRQPSTPEVKRTRLKDKIGRLNQEIERMKAIEAQLAKGAGAIMPTDLLIPTGSDKPTLLQLMADRLRGRRRESFKFNNFRTERARPQGQKPNTCLVTW